MNGKLKMITVDPMMTAAAKINSFGQFAIKNKKGEIK
jgi:hypothetical protein